MPCWLLNLSLVLTLSRSEGQCSRGQWSYISGERRTKTEQSRQSKTGTSLSNPRAVFNYSQGFGCETSKVTTPVMVTCLIITITACASSDLGSVPIVGFFFHLLQLLSTCVPFLLVASEDTLKGDVINWCMFIGASASLCPTSSSWWGFVGSGPASLALGTASLFPRRLLCRRLPLSLHHLPHHLHPVLVSRPHQEPRHRCHYVRLHGCCALRH